MLPKTRKKNGIMTSLCKMHNKIMIMLCLQKGGGEIPPTCMSEERERGRGKRNKERAGGKKGRAGKCGVGQK